MIPTAIWPSSSGSRRDGRIRYIDAHPDNSLTRGLYDQRFVRASPGMGAGFKNWRPQKLVGYAQRADSMLAGGRVLTAMNSIIPDFALTQFFGTGRCHVRQRLAQRRLCAERHRAWTITTYVRASLGGGPPAFRSGARDGRDGGIQLRRSVLSRRSGDAVAAGRPAKPGRNRSRLPPNIYGTEGDWETYSTPSRDARLKTAFKEAARQRPALHDAVARPRCRALIYQGSDLAGDMLAAYDRAAAPVRASPTRAATAAACRFGYEDARRRLFRLSFDPYHCVERRWGADGAELATCRDGARQAALV